MNIQFIVSEVKNRRIGEERRFKRYLTNNVSELMKYEHSDSGSPVNSKWGKWKDTLTDICQNKTAEPQRSKIYFLKSAREKGTMNKYSLLFNRTNSSQKAMK